jgi:hypothetical protein
MSDSVQAKLLDNISRLRAGGYQHFDPDIRQQALWDIQKTMEQRPTISSETMESVTKAVVDMLEDKGQRENKRSAEVMAQAASCFGVLTKVVSDDCMLDALPKLMEKLQQPSRRDQHIQSKTQRDLYAGRIKDIIERVAPKSGARLCANLSSSSTCSPRTLLEAMQDSEPQMKQHATSTVASLLQRFGAVMEEATLEEYLGQAIRELHTATAGTVLATEAISVIANYCRVVVREKVEGVITTIMALIAGSSADAAILCVSQIAKEAGHNVGEKLNDLLELLQSELTTATEDSSDEKNDRRAHCLSALGSLVAFCPAITEGSRVDVVLASAIALIAYNPNFDDTGMGFAAAGDDSDDEESDDEFGGGDDDDDDDADGDEWDDAGAVQDDGDTSWKVRSAACELFSMAVQYRSGLVRKVMEHMDIWIERFTKETENNVSLELTRVFTLILVAMAAKDRSDARIAAAVDGPRGAGGLPIPMLRRQSSSVSVMVERAGEIVKGATGIISSRASSEQVKVNSMAMVNALIEVCAVDGDDNASFISPDAPELNALLKAILPFVTSVGGTLLSLPAVQIVGSLGSLFPYDLRPQVEVFIVPLVECAEAQYPSLAVASLKALGSLANALRPLNSSTKGREVINGQVIIYGEVAKASTAAEAKEDARLAQLILDEGGHLFLETEAALDSEIIEAAINAGGLLVSRCADLFDDDAVGETVESLTEKLGVASTRLVAMVALVTIVSSSLPITLSKAQMDGVFNASTELLQSPDVTVKQAALVTLKALYAKFGGAFKNKSMKKNLVKQVRELIEPDNFSLCTRALELAAVMRPHATLLIASCAAPASIVVRDFDASASPHLLAALKAFFGVVSGELPEEEVDVMAAGLMEAGFKARAIVTIAQVVATLLCDLEDGDVAAAMRQMVSSTSSATKLLAQLKAHPTDDDADLTCRLHLAVVGEIGRVVNVESSSSLNDLNTLTSNVWGGSFMPRIKKAASTAYGQLAGGSPGGVITFLSAQMRTSGAAIQWVLEALRSALRHANSDALCEHAPGLLDRVVATLDEPRVCAERDSRALISDCIGSMCAVSLAADSMPIITKIKSVYDRTETPLVKATIIDSVRIYIGEHLDENYQLPRDGPLGPVLAAFVGEMESEMDPSNLNNLDVITASLKLAGATVRRSPMLLKKLLAGRREILDAAVMHMAYRTDLIREVQLGPMKQKIDDALPIRKLSFNFLDACCVELMGVVAASNIVVDICGVGAHPTKGGTFTGICSALRWGPKDDPIVAVKAIALLGRLCLSAGSQVKTQLDMVMLTLQRYLWLPAAGKNAFEAKKKLYIAQGWVTFATSTMAVLSRIENVDTNRKYSDALAHLKSTDSVGYAELSEAYNKAMMALE